LFIDTGVTDAITKQHIQEDRGEASGRALEKSMVYLTINN
jgi:hypothetical protein